MTVQSLLVSIKPVYAEAIFAGEKTVELRRVRPRVVRGSQLVVYASAPVSAIIGTLTVESVIEANPDELWATIGAESGLDECTFESYFESAQVGFAIRISAASRFGSVIALETLREEIPGFRPPQSYQYLRGDRSIDKYLSSTLFSVS